MVLVASTLAGELLVAGHAALDVILGHLHGVLVATLTTADVLLRVRKAAFVQGDCLSVLAFALALGRAERTATANAPAARHVLRLDGAARDGTGLHFAMEDARRTRGHGNLDISLVAHLLQGLVLLVAFRSLLAATGLLGLDTVVEELASLLEQLGALKLTLLLQLGLLRHELDGGKQVPLLAAGLGIAPVSLLGLLGLAQVVANLKSLIEETIIIDIIIFLK
mmetsp:Transcript_24750/g.58441  ORF Transcript_24750/g.58441 Transcript_24750/m.58441 type:complete len:223 (-) Transcript_24750:85-753(-)